MLFGVTCEEIFGHVSHQKLQPVVAVDLADKHDIHDYKFYSINFQNQKGLVAISLSSRNQLFQFCTVNDGEAKDQATY